VIESRFAKDGDVSALQQPDNSTREPIQRRVSFEVLKLYLHRRCMPNRAVFHPHIPFPNLLPRSPPIPTRARMRTYRIAAGRPPACDKAGCLSALAFQFSSKQAERSHGKVTDDDRKRR